MKIKKITLSLFVFFTMFLNSAFATKLPDDVWNFVKKSYPKAQQRFDSVIILSDNLMYIPLYPPTNTTVNEIAIEYTYPQNQKLTQYPEVVLLNNGYSFLKVVKDEHGNYTLTKKDDLPIKVRLGLMPQDMLTPVGLKMPESLKLTLGDLLIPSKEESSLALNENEKEKIQNIYNPTVQKNELIPSVNFQNKKIYINPKNSKFLEVYDETSKNPLYELKLSSMPSKIIASEKTKIALVIYWSGKFAEIIDLNDERTLAQIELDANASDVVLNKKDNIAYLSSQNANSIYVIDLNSMQKTQVIKLDQKPSKLAYCETDSTLSFYDEYSSKIFNMAKNGGEYTVQPLGNAKNVSKIINDTSNVYVISRTDNQLIIFDKISLKQKDAIDLDEKPTDAVLYENKLFILCSKNGYMNVYDILNNKLISREQLSKNGFYSKLTLIPDNNNLLITGINSGNYLIYNLETMKLVEKQESYINVANIIFYNKIQEL